MISVCIATYNGKDYILDQLDSILRQIPLDAEVLICDDNSSDETATLVASVNDSRIKLLRNNSNLGYVRNFERLISAASGQYIFLSDQDDIWPSGRVALMLDAMARTNSSVVVGGMELFETDVGLRSVSPLFSSQCDKTPWVNIFGIFMGWKSLPYFGCCMLISKDLKAKILPFRSHSISHDIWIALISNIEGKVCHLVDVVTYRRIHASNVTKSDRSLISKIKTRIVWATALIKFFFKFS